MSVEAKTVPHLTAAALGINISADSPPELRQLIESYLDNFAEPSGKSGGGFVFGNKCLSCDSPLTGMLGTFRWDLCWGEFRCGKCGWPGRAHHSIKDESGEVVGFNNVALQYHPDYVETKPVDDEDA